MNLLESIIQKGDLAQLKKLAHENPQLIRGASENGLPYIFFAAQNGQLAIVRYLL